MCTDLQFRAFVIASFTYKEVALLLCETDYKSTASIKRRIVRQNLDATHLGIRMHAKFSDEIIKLAIKEATSMKEVASIIGASEHPGAANHIKQRVDVLGFDTSHFTIPNSNFMAKTPARTIEDTLILFPSLPVRPVSGQILKRLLLELGRKLECAECSMVEWKGKPITLQVDHMNSKPYDNRAENLQFLCGLCHEQTSGFKNKKREGPNGESVEELVAVQKKKRYQASLQPCSKCDTGKVSPKSKTGECLACRTKKDITVKESWPSAKEIVKRVNETSISTVAAELKTSHKFLRKYVDSIEGPGFFPRKQKTRRPLSEKVVVLVDGAEITKLIRKKKFCATCLKTEMDLYGTATNCSGCSLSINVGATWPTVEELRSALQNGESIASIALKANAKSNRAVRRHLERCGYNFVSKAFT